MNDRRHQGMAEEACAGIIWQIEQETQRGGILKLVSMDWFKGKFTGKHHI